MRSCAWPTRARASPMRPRPDFRALLRADPSRSRSNGGSGLGLSIVAALVKAHGGRVGLDDADVGTTIAVHLPLADGSDGRGGDEAVADAAHLGPVEANR